MRRRFFVDQFDSGSALMRDEAAHHLGRVLRAREGQRYELSDGSEVWLARIDRVSRDAVHFALEERLPAVLPSLAVTLLLSVVKFDAFEWALEKATELGVSRVVPLAAARSEKALLHGASKRAERWRRILLESSQQSRRLKIPELADLAAAPAGFSSAVAELCLLLSERAEAPPLKSRLVGSAARSVSLAIGPEGGWTGDEISAASEAGFLDASLGSLILRTETAVIAALASLNYALGGE